MDERTKRVAQAICAREHGAPQCKTCRNANWVYNPTTGEDDDAGLGDGCLGLGYEYLAVIAIEAADHGQPAPNKELEMYRSADGSTTIVPGAGAKCLALCEECSLAYRIVGMTGSWHEMCEVCKVKRACVVGLPVDAAR